MTEFKESTAKTFFIILIEFICWWCKLIFVFNNKLHRYIQNAKYKKKSERKRQLMKAYYISSESIIVKSTVSEKTESDFDFQNWKYITVTANFIKKVFTFDLYLNTDCSISLINKIFLNEILLSCLIIKFNQKIFVREIEDKIYSYNKYAMFDLFLFFKSGKEMMKLYQKIWIIKNLKIKMLININIIRLKNIIVNLYNNIAWITECNDLEITVITKLITSNSINRIVWFLKSISMSLKSMMMISLKLHSKIILMRDQNFLFESIKYDLKIEEDFVTHIINSETKYIEINNITDKSVLISWHIKLERIMKYETEECYQTDIKKFITTESLFW